MPSEGSESEEGTARTGGMRHCGRQCTMAEERRPRKNPENSDATFNTRTRLGGGGNQETATATG